MVLNWIFEGIVNWVSSIVTQLMDAVSGIFLNALGTEMTAMEEYFPFVARAFSIMQYTAWTILFLITVWQLFRSFGGSITEAENPWSLLARSVVFAVLIYFAKPIFLYLLEIATAPYTALLNVSMNGEHFTFAGIEASIKSGLVSIVSTTSVVGLLLIIILMIALGWNYFKLLLEVVERYVVVGVLCYTSPLAYSMGASKATGQVFKSWCRMVGSQLLMLVMNVWFLRAFSSSIGQFVGGGAGLSNGQGHIFLWLFCAIAFLKTAQRFDSYLASIGLNAAQTGSGLGMELLMAARIVTGAGGGIMRNAGNVFRGGGMPGAGAATTAGMSGFTNKFKGNSFVRDAVVQGGQRMALGGAVGVIGRAFGGIAARNGATLTGSSISSVASSSSNMSGKIGGSIADRSLVNYMPHLSGQNLTGTEITGGKITTTAQGVNGKSAELNMFNADQYEKPDGPCKLVTASDGSQWYQTASGEGASSFYDTAKFSGGLGEAGQVQSMFPDAEDGTTLRSVDDGIMEATTSDGNSLWYNSGYFEEPSAPHATIQSADGVDWYAMQPNGQIPEFESGTDAGNYNVAQFKNFMPGYEQSITSVNGENATDGYFEVRHDDGSGTMFYDASRYASPHGEYKTYEDIGGHQWYAINGTPTVERVPVYENGNPVYDGDKLKTTTRANVRYSNKPTRYAEPKQRSGDYKPPRKKK